jgi:hypothetical protein
LFWSQYTAASKKEILGTSSSGNHEQMQGLTKAWRAAEKFYKDYEQNDQPQCEEKHIG